MLCVTDANIWIDLANGELEEHVFQIGLELIIPNLVLVELRNPPSSRLKSIGLQPVNLSGDQLDELVGSLARRYPGPSRVDLSALLVARDEGLTRSEEHTSELQSLENYVCRLLLEKKNTQASLIS